MKFLFTADIHLSKYSQDKIEETTNLPERLYSIKTTLYEMANYCKENGIKHMIIGGDILHGKSIIYAIAQDIMLQFFKDFLDISFYVIDGNHDLSGKGEDAISALRPLENLPNVVWISKKSLHYVENEDSKDILFVPYTHEVAKEIKNKKASILISHFGLNEGILNSGISVVAEVKVKDLIGKYELVLLGHYHKPQEIINDNIKLYYVGSPIQLDWGEKNDQKRFLVIDTEILDVQSIPTTGYKKHIEIELTNKNKDEVFKLAEKAKEDGDHVKIIMKEKVALDKKDERFNIVDKTETDVTDRGITSSMSMKDKVDRYMEIKEIPTEDIERYETAALNIIERCSENDS